MKLEVWSLSTIARSLGQDWNQVKLTSEAREALSGRKIVLLVEVWRKKKKKIQVQTIEDVKSSSRLKPSYWADQEEGCSFRPKFQLLSASSSEDWTSHFAKIWVRSVCGEVLRCKAYILSSYCDSNMYDFISLVSQLILNSFALCHNCFEWKYSGKWILKSMFHAFLVKVQGTQQSYHFNSLLVSSFPTCQVFAIL